MSKALKTTIRRNQGFTLLEILLVVGIISILAGIVILAINPTKQLGDTRNAQRRSDVLTILNAAYQFSIDHNGKLPTDNPEGTGTIIIPSSDKDTACDTTDTDSEIARNGDTGSAIGSGDVDLWPALVQDTASTTYLVSIPTDPSRDVTESSGYHIFRTFSGRVTVCAPHAENSADIYVTR